MKKIILAAFFGIVLSTASAQIIPAGQIPVSVRVGFDKHYPHARKVTWTRAEGGYQVVFETSHSKYFVTYSHGGEIILQTIEFHKVRLPHSVRKKIEKNYAGFIVENSTRVDFGVGSIYVAEIGRSEEGYKLSFNEQGDLMQVETIDELQAPK